MTDTAYIASTSSGRVVRTYHTDKDCRLGPSDERQREITVAKAKRRDLSICDACNGTVTPNTGNDPQKYIRRLKNNE